MEELLTSQCLDFLDVTSSMLHVVTNTEGLIISFLISFLISLCFTELSQINLATRPLLLLGCGDTPISAINTIDSATALPRSRELCKS
jgi:hypothetical protein